MCVWFKTTGFKFESSNFKVRSSKRELILKTFQYINRLYNLYRIILIKKSSIKTVQLIKNL